MAKAKGTGSKKSSPTASAETKTPTPSATKQPSATEKTTPEAKAAAKSPAKSQASSSTVTAEERYRLIAEAAYYRAESSRFQGDPVAFWLEAEAEVNRKLLAQNQKDEQGTFEPSHRESRASSTQKPSVQASNRPRPS